MAQTCDEMATEVQALCGRTDDTVLIAAAQLTTWFNEAQRDIVDRIPGLHGMTFKNTTSHDTTQTLAYAIGDITAGDYTSQPISSIWDVWYLDGADSLRLHFVHTDEFDAQWPDPTNDDAVFDRPYWWTRRGSNIELVPLSGCSYCDKDLRFDGDFYARDLTAASADSSDITGAEEGLKMYALAKAWRAIGDKVKAVDYSVQYEQWLDNYEHKNNRLNEWDGGLYSDNIAE